VVLHRTTVNNALSQQHLLPGTMDGRTQETLAAIAGCLSHSSRTGRPSHARGCYLKQNPISRIPGPSLNHIQQCPHRWFDLWSPKSPFGEFDGGSRRHAGLRGGSMRMDGWMDHRRCPGLPHPLAWVQRWLPALAPGIFIRVRTCKGRESRGIITPFGRSGSGKTRCR